MFEDALRYPWTGDDKLETLLIGGLLGLLGMFVVPVFLVFGYLVSVIRQVSDGEDAVPPSFGDWGRLLVDGVKAFVVVVVYGLVPAVAITLATLALVLPVTFVEERGADAVAETGSALDPIGVLLALGVVAIALGVSLAFLYLLPAGVAAFARTGRLRAAFSPRELRRIGLHGRYATGWVVAVAITILANVVAGALTLTVAGAVLVPFVSFYGNVAGAYAIGRGVRDLPGGEADVGSTATGRSAA